MARYIKMKNGGFNKVAVVADDGKSPGAHILGQWDSCTWGDVGIWQTLPGKGQIVNIFDLVTTTQLYRYIIKAAIKTLLTNGCVCGPVKLFTKQVARGIWPVVIVCLPLGKMILCLGRTILILKLIHLFYLIFKHFYFMNMFHNVHDTLVQWCMCAC